MENKKNLVCETCGEEFEELIDGKINPQIGEHAIKEHHYSFKLKGTNLKLAIV